MDCQVLLERLASDRGLPLTALSQMSRLSHSQKVACCGGVVVRVETESSADSTVCLRDDSGTCFCALHGDLTSRYPDVLSPGALLCFANITLLVTSVKMPPLLVACLENMVGLMLPEEDTSEEAVSTRTSDRATGASHASFLPSGPGVVRVRDGREEEGGKEETPAEFAIGESLDVLHPQNDHGSARVSSPNNNHSPSQARPPLPPPPQQRGEAQRPAPTATALVAKPSVAGTAAPVKAEVISDDDEDCLELVDDF